MSVQEFSFRNLCHCRFILVNVSKRKYFFSMCNLSHKSQNKEHKQKSTVQWNESRRMIFNVNKWKRWELLQNHVGTFIFAHTQMLVDSNLTENDG